MLPGRPDAVREGRRWAPYLVAAILLALAGARLSFTALDPRMDGVFLALLAGAALALLVPWHEMRGLKWGSFEITMQERIDGALAEIRRRIQVSDGPERPRGDRYADELRAELDRLAPHLEHLRGRRVLWVDDNAPLVLAERRLLRSLGMDVVAVGSSEQAAAALHDDTDFDLFVSDIGRDDEPPVRHGSGEVKASVAFVQRIRDNRDDPRTRGIPVIFYSAHTDAEMAQETAPARVAGHPLETCNTPPDLLRAVVKHILFPPPSAAVLLVGKNVEWKKRYGDSPGRRAA